MPEVAAHGKKNTQHARGVGLRDQNTQHARGVGLREEEDRGLTCPEVRPAKKEKIKISACPGIRPAGWSR